MAEAAKTAQQPGFNPSNYAFHGGTEADDNAFFFDKNTTGDDVFCGFGGSDHISTIEAGDILLGGAGNDVVDTNLGTFYGGDGDDEVDFNHGTFIGGPGADSVGTGDPLVDGP